jgi:murein DD-endopeptidase MepM/ murein hydrolase activator NlpD
MNRLELYYPVRPHVVNRPWGFYSPQEYLPFGFTRHNGVDLNLVDGQSIFAPLEAEVVNIGNEPTGGGIFVSLLSSSQYGFDDVDGSNSGSNSNGDGTPTFVLLDFFHCQEIKVSIGDHVAIGQLIALGDNTGVTTGSHTHMQPRRETVVPAPVGATVNTYRFMGSEVCFMDFEKNDANNSFDPAPYWNGKYADEYNPGAIAELEEKVSDLTRVRNALIADLQKKTIPVETQPRQPIQLARAVRIVPAVPVAGKIKKIKKRLKKS